MKNRSLPFVCFVGCLCFTGCASRTVDAATTRFKVSNPVGTAIEISLPKEIDATKLELTVDPRTKVLTLKADKLKSSSQGVIESASAAQANALGEMAQTVRALIPLLPAK